MNAFWASENFDAFIVFRFHMQENHLKKTLLKSDPIFRSQNTMLLAAARVAGQHERPQGRSHMP